MMQVMNANTPFMKQPRRSPTPGAMSAGYSLNATAWAQALKRS
jgi:hypothetical protein